MPCTSETVGEVADDTMLESTNSDKKRKGDQTRYEYYCIHCPLENDQHGPTFTHGNAFRTHQIRIHNRAPKSWIRQGRVQTCPECGKLFLQNSNCNGSGNPHPKHATAEEKSRWITKDLSKEDLANTFALEREYGYPSSRAKGKKLEFRGDPDKYREWQEDQDARCGYLPEEWNALWPKKKHIEPKHEKPRKTTGHAAAGPSGKSTREQFCSVTGIPEGMSSEASHSIHEGIKLVAQAGVAHDSVLMAPKSSDMLQYAIDSSAHPMQSDARIEDQMPASSERAVEENSSWNFRDLQYEVRPPVLLSDELMAQMALGSVQSGSRYFTADDVHHYQNMLHRGCVVPLSHIYRVVLLRMPLVRHLGKGLAPRSSDAELREGLEMFRRKRGLGPQELSTRQDTPLSREIRHRQAENSRSTHGQGVAHERELGSRPGYSVDSTKPHAPSFSSATASVATSAPSSVTECQRASTEMSQTVEPSMQTGLTSFTGQWMPLATGLPDYPLFDQQQLSPQNAWDMESNQQKHNCADLSTKETTLLGGRISKDHQTARQRTHRQKKTRNTSQPGVSKIPSVSSSSKGRRRTTGNELGRSSPPNRRHSTAQMQSHISAHTHSPQAHRQSFSGFGAAIATESGAVSDATRPIDAHQEISRRSSAFPDSSRAQTQWNASGAVQVTHTPMQSTTRATGKNQFSNAYGHESWRLLPTVQDDEMLDVGASTPSLPQSDLDLSRSMMSSTLSNFSINTLSASRTKGQSNHNTPTFERDNDYQHEALQTLPAMPPDPQPWLEALSDSGTPNSRTRASDVQQTAGIQQLSFAEPRGPALVQVGHNDLNQGYVYHREIPRGLHSSSQALEPESMDYQYDTAHRDHGLANAPNYPQHTREAPYPLDHQAFQARMSPRAFGMPMRSQQPSQYGADPDAASQRTMEDRTVQATAHRANDRIDRIIADMCAKHFRGA
ncbi:hypothetical protein HII31_00621 [Pseudocercospora fuligena]|uniref:Uncharacterized protein n=1 Tax=Pseudocercospora fuligena TaxID=685502 RepID=A0A8H6VPM4_9PEZI|nr:hypothetical protein HII31_00621 [Pseudocercospora fuligena]